MAVLEAILRGCIYCIFLMLCVAQSDAPWREVVFPALNFFCVGSVLAITTTPGNTYRTDVQAVWFTIGMNVYLLLMIPSLYYPVASFF